MRIKFKEIYDSIEADIRGGVYDVTHKLLSEDEYADKYDVSRDTVRRATDLLIARGYCFPVQGKGVFLRRHKIEGAVNLENIGGLTQDLLPHEITSKVILFTEVLADKALAENMGCAIGTPLTCFERLRLIDNEPHSFETIYYVSSRIKVSEDVLNGSIFQYIKSNLKIVLAMTDFVIQAVKLTPREADLLGLKTGDPGLRFENFGMDRKGEIIHYGWIVYHFKKMRCLKMVSFL
jgi:GntR family transcriptional regulator of bglA